VEIAQIADLAQPGLITEAAWSGANPLRTEGRLASDVAHELSHVLLKHELSEVREVDGGPFRSCRPFGVVGHRPPVLRWPGSGAARPRSRTVGLCS
jgi:hypothetical protein